MNKKLGILESTEGKFFAGVIADNIEVKGIYKTGLKLTLPIFINAIDDKVGDKIPEPWQTYTEEMITAVYIAMQDGVVSQEEVDQIVEKCAIIINEEIDIPVLNEEDEALAFLFLLKTIATYVRFAFNKNKETEQV